MEEGTAKKDYVQSSLINPLLSEIKLEKMLSLFLCQYPLKQGWQTCGPRTLSVPPNTLQIFFQAPTMDSSATALAAARLLLSFLTCLPQQHLAASNAMKM